jgi:hypothetical protein
MSDRLYLSSQPRKGCFSSFGCGLVLIGILICVILTLYPDSPFRPSTLPNPFAQPTPAHHGKPSVRVLSVDLGPGQDCAEHPPLQPVSSIVC